MGNVLPGAGRALSARLRVYTALAGLGEPLVAGVLASRADLADNAGWPVMTFSRCPRDDLSDH